MIGAAVILLVGGAGLVFSKSSSELAEERLDGLSGTRRKPAELKTGMLLRPPAIDSAMASAWLKHLPNLDSLNTLYEQADVSMPFNRFMAMVGAFATIGFALPFGFGMHPLLAPVFSLTLASMPFLWLRGRRKARIKMFLDKMPEAVELIGRALRAGHGLASGMKLVSEEMKGPIADEFGRVFEEQNLGIPIEMSLRGMAERVPAMDVKFFVIAVIIQRATGGDLAEVLDKIGRLIRQRFELNGHVKALTAEGRLSGIVLLALPPGLLAFLSISNYGYVEPLFTTPLGNKMLMVTAGMQVLGAWMIKKIVAIKV
ncbi:MAG: type II secretion system F family protein [Thermoleophilia bacterium]|nr:type II secretion system F family protein [Thermoleophilia bacterium]